MIEEFRMSQTKLRNVKLREPNAKSFAQSVLPVFSLFALLALVLTLGACGGVDENQNVTGPGSSDSIAQNDSLSSSGNSCSQGGSSSSNMSSGAESSSGTSSPTPSSGMTSSSSGISCSPVSSSSVFVPVVPLPFSQMIREQSVSRDWTGALLETWEGVKTRNIDAYTVPLVHRPYSEEPHDAVSEGVGYGMILALYNNDQTYFNKVWDAGEEYLWAGSHYNWRADVNGSIIGSGSAADADVDIAMMLIFADHLVQQGVWTEHNSPNGVTYAQRAQSMLNFIWGSLIDGQGFLLPWPGAWDVNPGYFAPAFFKVFDEFDSDPNHNWSIAVDRSYTSLNANPGASLGLGPDWMSKSSQLLPSGPGYNAFDNGQSMYKDGIRIFWRLATDAVWFDEPRAKSFLEKAMVFIDNRASTLGSADHPNSPAHLANFYDMQGNPVSAEAQFIFDGGNKTRPRYEHSHLTLGMWGAAAIGAGDMEKAEAFSRQLGTFYESGDYWGNAVDPLGGIEDTTHNEMYFDQFLAWFGASLMNGSFCNITECVP